jgi:beta-lactamase superfamily II metal-dependent hydrolase
MRRFILLAALTLGAMSASAQTRPLEIYWIDVEGGAATLFVTPSGESMLFDTGWNERDAQRIVAAARQAGLTKIDALVLSHYHTDHAGGLTALTKLMPIGRYYGRNDEIEPVNQQWLDSYRTAAAGKRVIVKAGDTIPLKGVDVLAVASDGKVLARTLPGGGPNSLCVDAAQMPPAGPENQNMVGLMLTYGRFTFLAPIDLDWEKEMEFACPTNRLGKVTLYQSGRHGAFDGAGAPAFLGAISPQVVVVNNGPRKGLGQVDDKAVFRGPNGGRMAAFERNAYLRLATLPGIEGIWQGHKSLLDPDATHNTSPDMIANMEETADCKGHWIKASVAGDGAFTVTNGRNGFSKRYVAR